MTIINLFRKIADSGTENVLSIEKKRRIKLTNYYLLISLASTLIYKCIYLLVDFKELQPVITVSDAFVPLFIIGIVLNKLEFHISASLLLCFGITGVVYVVTGVYYGNTSGIHYYFLLFAIVPVMLWSFKQFYFILFFAGINISLFVYVEIFKTDSSILIHFPAEAAPIVKLISVISVFSSIVLIFGLFKKEMSRSENILSNQKIALENSNVLLKKQKEEIDIRSHELMDANNTKDMFFSIIAHDLMSPVGSFKTLLDYVNEHYESFTKTEVHTVIKEISQSSSSILDLLENLLMWSRSQKGQINFEPVDCDLKPIVDKTFNLYSEVTRNKGIILSTNLKNKTICSVDKNMIRTVIRNLVSNAIKFSNSNSVVQVNINEDVPIDFLGISVIDSGVGMSDEQIAKIFSNGHLVSTKGTNNERGTGLGLILCRDFVERHGGSINVKSKVGLGSNFTFTIPLKH